MAEAEQSTPPKTQFDELPDAPPKRGLKLSWTGKLGVTGVIFWLFIVAFGPAISPYHEADILDEELFVVPGGDPYPDTDFQPPSSIASNAFSAARRRSAAGTSRPSRPNPTF